MGRIVSCTYCKQQLNSDVGIRYKGKLYHKNCYQEQIEREELSKYICKVFGLKAPGPRNYSMMKKFREEYGYTYKGMLNTLKYFYEVKGAKTEKANESIGIIPHIYNDAKAYYKDLENKSKLVGKSVQEQLQTPIGEAVIKVKKNERKGYCLEDL